MWVSSNLMFFSSDVSFLTKHNLQISLFCVLTRFLDFIKIVITMQYNKMTVFVKIAALDKSGTILHLLIFHSSLLSSKFMANWCQSELEDPGHVMIVIEVEFFKVLLIYLFLCCSFLFSYASSMHWNEILHPGDFLFHTFKTIDELNDRYLENCNECFIISTFGLCAVVLLFSLVVEFASLFQYNA